jgi:putative salt-induced outer membrane protein YdiY
MTSRVARRLVGLTLAAALASLPAAAQEAAAAPPPDPWSGTLGLGLALTSGNSDTRSYNLSFTAVHDPKARNVFKAEGLYLRAEQDGEATADKTSLGLRDEYKLSARAFAFGQVGFLRDRFKQLDSLIAPLVGLGVRAIDDERVKLAFDAGLGGAFEKLEGQDATTSGAVQAGQGLTLVLSPSATFTQSATALWKMEDFGDAVYRLQAGLTATVSKRLELKLAYTKDIKTRLAATTLVKSDDSLLANLVFKL